MSEEELRESVETLRQQSEDLGIQVDFLADYLLEQDNQLKDVKKAYFEALYYLSNTSYEIRLFIDELFDASQQGRYSHLYKYLALLIHEGQETIPVLVSRIAATPTTAVNTRHITDAKKLFNKSLKDQLKLLGINDVLTQIRNQAGAHHLDKKDQSISYLLLLHEANRVAWVNGKKFHDSTLVAAAVSMCAYINQLADAILSADDAGYINELHAYIRYRTGSTS